MSFPGLKTSGLQGFERLGSGDSRVQRFGFRVLEGGVRYFYLASSERG